MVTHDRRVSTPEEGTLLDHIAALTQDADAHLAEIRDLYERTPNLHLPPEYPLS